MRSHSAAASLRYALRTDLQKLYLVVGTGIVLFRAEPFHLIGYQPLRSALTLVFGLAGLVLVVAGLCAIVHYVVSDVQG